MDVNNLTGVYNQNPTLQGQYTLQQYLDLFGGSSTGTTTPTTNTTTPTTNSGQGIINQNINQFQNQGDGQDNRGTRTYTSLQDRAPSINRNDRSFIDPLNEKIANQMRTQNPNLQSRTNAEIISSNSDMFDIKTNKGFVGNTMDNMKTMGGNLVDKFSGLPGVDQTKGFFKNVMDNTMVGRIASMRDATNPKAANYNPNLIDQKDYALRGVDQGGLGYTQDDIGRFTGQAVDPSKPNYNPLAGLALQSGFGSNDLGTMYEKELARLAGYQKKKFSQTRKDKIDKINELIEQQKQAAIDKFEQEKKAAGIAAMAAQNKANNTGGYQYGTQGGGSGAGSDFMEGKGTSAEMGSTKDGGIIGHGGTGGRPAYGGSVKSYFKGGVVSLRNGGAPMYSEEDFPILLDPRRPDGSKPSLYDYDGQYDNYDDEVIEIPTGAKMKKPKKKKKKKTKTKSYFKGGLVSLRGR